MQPSLYKSQFRSQKRRKTIVRFIKMLMVLSIVWLIGLSWFIGFKPQPTDIEKVEATDGIVVLTGGVGRIEAGAKALSLGLGKRMLISGVNANIETQTIFNAYGLEVENCNNINSNNTTTQPCINLGRTALDTKGNAIEASLWAKENGFSSLILITSEYHMQRALLEMDMKAPNIEIQPVVVETDLRWTSIALEYTKFLYSLTQHFIFT